MKKDQTGWWNAVVNSPILWGGCAAVAFYYAIETKLVTHPMIVRYFAGHWVEYAETILFAIGVVAQLFKVVAARSEVGVAGQVTLGAIPDAGQAPSDAPALIEKLETTPAEKRGWLYERLWNALDFVRRHRSADKLDDELKFLADADHERRATGHSLTKVIIWAIPILGFLGTVLGLTDAVSNLSADAEALKASLSLVTAGLGAAFDTTGLALVLSMVLMFAQYFVDKIEGSMLARVDERTQQELAGRFRLSEAGPDPIVERIHGIAENVLDATAEIVSRQADLWKASLDEGKASWTASAERQQELLEDALKKAIADGLRAHAEMVAETERRFAAEQRAALERVTEALRLTSEAVARQHHELTRQGEVLLQVVEATGQVARLEDALNRNLGTLANTGRFEDTLHSLSAAIHLLTAKLGENDALARGRVALPKSRSEGHAA